MIPTLKDAFELKTYDRIHTSEYKKIATEGWYTKYEKLSNIALTIAFLVGVSVGPSTEIKGTFSMGSQYHFSMETQTTICLPTENGGVDVYASTYWMDFTQMAIARCLNIPENSINMVVRRLGGSYGCKITRAAMVACAAALGCHLTKRPVRFVMTLESNMSVIGKRYSLHSEYNVHVDSASGRIINLENQVTADNGCSYNDNMLHLFELAVGSCYDNASWSFHVKTVLTDVPTQTFCRAPGTLKATALAENTMEHIAFETGIDPLLVRLANMPSDSPLRSMLDKFLIQCGKYL